MRLRAEGYEFGSSDAMEYIMKWWLTSSQRTVTRVVIQLVGQSVTSAW